jgi:hypothetical protein
MTTFVQGPESESEEMFKAVNLLEYNLKMLSPSGK